MPNTFRAAVLVEVQSPLLIKQLTLPLIMPGQVLVRNLFTGVCRSQIMEVTGQRGNDKWLPHLLGHESVGIVEKVGKSVVKVKPGDKVVVSWIRGVGLQEPNPVFKDSEGHTINSGPVTTFSEYTLTSECFVTLAPFGIDDHILTLLGCSFLTGAGMALRSIDDAYKRIAIIGFGGVGSAAALIASISKIADIIIIEESSARRNLAKELGFLDILSYEQASKLHGSIDLCLEAGGTIKTIELGFQLISTKGKLVFASHPRFGDKICLDPHDLISGKKIEGSWGGGSLLDSDVKTVSTLIKKMPNLNLLVGNLFSLHEVNEALNNVELTLPGRSIIKL